MARYLGLPLMPPIFFSTIAIPIGEDDLFEHGALT
jgi:hypothetical protein